MQSPPSLIERLIFNKPSAIIHTLVFVVWFAIGWNVNLLTNIVSLEAIYLSIFIGIGTQDVHKHIDK